MTSQFSPKVSEILAFSREEANRLASKSVGPEHLLLGILRGKSGPVIDLFRRLEINIQKLKAELEQRVKEEITQENTHISEIALNEQANNILKLAVLEARIQHTQLVDVQHLLLAILHDQVANGAKVALENNQLDYETALQMLQKKPTTDGLGLPDEMRNMKTTLWPHNTMQAIRTNRQPQPKSKVLQRLPCLTTSRPTLRRRPMRESSIL